MICKHFSKYRRYLHLFNLIESRKFRFSTRMVDKSYKSNYVDERFFKKPQPKFLIGQISRVDHIVSNAESYFDKEATVAGWSRTLRYSISI